MVMSEINDNVLLSLVFFYFGFDNKDSKELALKRIGAFNAMDEAKNVEKRELANDMTSRMFSLMDNYCPQNEHFDNWHKTICTEVLGDICKKHEVSRDLFTIGNAQKFLNMTLKYLYLFSELPFENLNDITSKVALDAAALHVPIDSYIIDRIIKNEIIVEQEHGLGERFKWLQGNNYPKKEKLKDKNIPSNYLIGWSKWNSYEDYKDVQDRIREIIEKNSNHPPIEWESEEWIKASKDRRNK